MQIIGDSYAGGSDEQNPVFTLVRTSNYSLISVQMQYRLGPFGTRIPTTLPLSAHV